MVQNVRLSFIVTMYAKFVQDMWKENKTKENYYFSIDNAKAWSTVSKRIGSRW